MNLHDNGRPFALVQITDTHLFADPTTRYRGWNTDAALDAVLEQLSNDGEAIDAVLLTGDLAEDEAAETYERLGTKLRALNKPCYALPGNHDDPQAMQAQLGMQVLGSAQLGSWDLLMLNSHQPGSVNGWLPDAELARAADFLRQQSRPCLIAVHHPPIDIGSPWLDSIGLDNRQALMQTVAGQPQLRAILCGHAHQHIDQQQAGLRILGCPSTWRQFLPGASEPQEDRQQTPGYRRLYLHHNGQFDTAIHRLPGNEGKI